MKKILFSIFSAALIVSGCANDELDIANARESVAVAFTASNISSAQLLQADNVGVFAGEDIFNVEYTVAADGTMSASNPSDAIMLTSAAMQSYCAYYPYDADMSQSTISITAPIENDMVWGMSNSSNSQVALTFASAYTTLNINVTGVTQSDFTCKVVGAISSAKFDVATGEITESKKENISIPLDIDNGAASASFMLLPSDDLSGIYLLFESAQGNYKYPFYFSQNAYSEWSRGKSYRYDVELPATYTLVTGVSLNAVTCELMERASGSLTATVAPAEATNQSVVWSTSDFNVVEVNQSGNLTTMGEGEATITVTTIDGGYSASCKVTVTGFEDIEITSISLNSNSEELGMGKTFQLEATINPSNATDKRITWSSSNPSVATVDSDGVVTAKMIGTTTITATSTSWTDISASCEFTITDALAVGSYMYTDGYSAVYDSQRTLEGIVYQLNGDGKSGMIVQLPTTITLTRWSTHLDATSEFQGVSNANSGYGLNNMNAVLTWAKDKGDSRYEQFPAFKLADDLNIAKHGEDGFTYANGNVDVWYIPDEGELGELLTAIFGADPTATSLINEQITAAGGEAFVAGSTDPFEYMTSSEASGNKSNFRAVRYNINQANPCQGNGYSKASASRMVRLVKAFAVED